MKSFFRKHWRFLITSLIALVAALGLYLPLFINKPTYIINNYYNSCFETKGVKNSEVYYQGEPETDEQSEEFPKGSAPDQ